MVFLKLLRNKNRFLTILAIIVIASMSIRFLFFIEYAHTGLLYLGIPFLVGLALLYFTEQRVDERWSRAYWNNFRDSLIIMLCSSVILFEGFVCVLMFMPIYFLVLLLVFVIGYFENRSRKARKLNMHGLTVIILLASLEGTHPNLTFNRDSVVNATQVVNMSIHDLKENIRKPVILGGNQPWFLNIFPSPTNVDAGTLYAGAVHKIDYVYNRWFFTNTHSGHMLLEMTQVEDNFIKTTILEDTSYISNYIKLTGTRIDFKEIDSKTTEVTLNIFYIRKLDPYWYFGPLEQYGITKSAEYLLSKIIVRTD